MLARGEQAEQSTITINLGGFARGRKARLQWRIAFVNSPLPQRWLQFNYRDFKQTWVVGFLAIQEICNADGQHSSPEVRHNGYLAEGGTVKINSHYRFITRMQPISRNQQSPAIRRLSATMQSPSGRS